MILQSFKQSHIHDMKRETISDKFRSLKLSSTLESSLIYGTTWSHGIIRTLHRIGLRGRLPIFLSEYFKYCRIQVKTGTTLSNEFCPEGVTPGGVLAVTCFELKINKLNWHNSMAIFRALFVDDPGICFIGAPLIP